MSDLLTFSAWDDPVVDAIGVPVGSLYVEQFWLPIIGPSATWMLRHVARHTGDGPYLVDRDTLARSLGLSGGSGRHCVVRRTLTRLVLFDCGHGGVDTWALRRRLGPVPARRLRRLPDPLRDAHDALTLPDAAVTA